MNTKKYFFALGQHVLWIPAKNRSTKNKSSFNPSTCAKNRDCERVWKVAIPENQFHRKARWLGFGSGALPFLNSITVISGQIPTLPENAWNPNPRLT